VFEDNGQMASFRIHGGASALPVASAALLAILHACATDPEARRPRDSEGGAAGLAEEGTGGDSTPGTAGIGGETGVAGTEDPGEGGAGATNEGGTPSDGGNGGSGGAPGADGGADGSGGAPGADGGADGSGGAPGADGGASASDGGGTSAGQGGSTAAGSAGESAAGAGGEGPLPLACPVLDPSRVHYMTGRVQNSRPITFGAGEYAERTITFDGAYFAAFDRVGCFMWVSLIDAGFIVTPAWLEIDAAGGVYMLLRMDGELVLQNPDGTTGASFTMAGTGIEQYKRGVVLAKYDPGGNVLYAKRFGDTDPAETQPHTYNAVGQSLRGNTLRISGFMNASGGPDESFDFVVGEGETNQEIVTLDKRYRFGFTMAFDPATGDYLADTLRLGVGTPANSQDEFRYSARGTGSLAADGSFVQATLFADPGTFLINFDEPDELSETRVPSFSGSVIGFTPAGAIAWQRAVSEVAGGMGFHSMAVASDGTSFVAGSGPDNMIVEADSQGTTVTVTGRGFWLNYDASGDLIWTRSNTVGASHLFLDEDRGKLLALGNGVGAQTFGVGETDQLDVDFGPRSAYLAQVDPATGSVEWLSRVEGPTGSGETGFRNLTRVGDEIVVSARFDGQATLDPGGPDEVVVGTSGPDLPTGPIWSGAVRYGLDGSFLGYVEYIQHSGTRNNDGLTTGVVVEP
jgi:hypothetical protein